MLIVIILFALIFIVTLVFTFSIKKTPIENIQMHTLCEDSLITTAIDLAKTLRVTTLGVGINTHSLYNKIDKVNRIIAVKNSRNIPLYESEKWLYENFYLVYRNIFSSRNIFNELPHINGIPRIIIIARHIVRNSLNELDTERVRKVFNAIKDSVSLNFMEIRVINQALSFAILEQIYILADRILFQDNCKNTAIKKNIDKTLIKYDSYCFYLFEYHNLLDYEIDFLNKHGIDKNKVALSHNKTIMENAQMAQSLFSALHNINDFVPINDGIKYLAMNTIMEKSKDYSNVSTKTKLAYYSIIEKISKSININEAYIMQKACELADYNDIDVSIVLYDHKCELRRYTKNSKLLKLKPRNTIWQQRLYIAAVLIISIVLCYSTGNAINSVLIGFLSFIPAIFISENALGYLLSFMKREKIIPSMNFSVVPFEYNTMVVISEYVTSIEQLLKSIKHAETIKANSQDDNIQVALLLDLKKSKTPIDIIDKETEDLIANYVFSENINIFIRKRTLVSGIYQGWERKRGAILTLNKMLMSKDTKDFSLILHNDFPCPKYIVTLDADNMVCPNTVREMVNMIVHPYNQKYDLLSTQNRYNLFSYNKIYSRRFLMESGIDNYPFYSTFYYSFFDREIYCGKGIYKLSSFYKKIEGIFPDNCILSHDIIEGSVLNTGTANIIFEDVPSGFLSDRERRIRWQRGDIQLLPFKYGRWQDAEGKKCVRKIQPLYKYVMSKNILYNLKELMLLSILLIGIFTKNWAIVLQFVGLFYMPFLLNSMKINREVVSNIRIKFIIQKLIRNWLLCIEDFFMIGYYAISNTYILISTLYRMMMKTKLLEWKPYYNSQTSTQFASYVKEFSIPTLILTALNVLIFFFGNYSILFNIYILLSFFIYIRLYFLSSRDYKKYPLGADDQRYLTDIAQKTYKYFDFMRNNKGIIADNFQIKPYKGESKVTSPTNIGFSLLAEICAYKLQIISLDKCNYNLIKTLDTIEKLEKWQGNLYNWYDLETFAPSNKFVSSVDSGNFLTSLLIVKEFFHENENMVGELRTQLLIKTTNLEALYDQSKNLFYLGYDGLKLTGHYDLLSSEARLLSMIFIALYGKSEHYNALHRDYTSLKGNTMLSWSGTMFEYLMPDLFLPLPCFSTLKNTAINVINEQIKSKWNGVWGISESAYALFDEKQHYQYHAFGLSVLSLRNEVNKGVVSPYSSALSLAYKSGVVVDNFHKLEKLNLLDEYGFLESIDLTNNAIIYSYMSHHQGMIICAITNKLRDNYLVKLLQNNVKIRGAVQLFNENLFKARNGVIYRDTPKISTATKYEYYKYCDNLEQYYSCAALTDASTTQYFSANGNSFCMHNNTIIDKFVPVYQEATGGYFYVKNESNEYYSPTLLPLNGKQNNFTFAYSGTQIFYQNISENLNLSIAIMSGIDGVVRKLSYSKYTKEVSFYMPITLNSFDGYYSHPAFNDLFIETFVSKDILYVKRRSLNKDGEDKYIAVLLKGLKNIVWETNRINFIGRNGNLEKPNKLFYNSKNLQNPSIGDTLSPCIAFSATPTGIECQVCILFGNTLHELEEKIKMLPEDFYSFALACASRYLILQLTQEILGELFYANYPNKLLLKVSNTDYFEKFKSYVDNKKVVSYVYSEDRADKFFVFIDVVKNLQLLNLPVKIVIYVKNRGNNNLIQYVNDTLHQNVINDFIILDDPTFLEYSFIAFDEELQFTRKQIALVKIEEIYKNINKNVDSELELGEGFVSGYGCFDAEGNYLQKSIVPTPLPYSDIISAKYGGIIATNNGGGYYYFTNSRENKMVRFDNDFVTDAPSELICSKSSLGYLILNGGCGKNRITHINKGEIIHELTQNGLNSTCSSFVILDGKAKITELDIENNLGGFITLIYTMYPSLDWVFDPTFICYKFNENILEISNLRKNAKVFIRIISDSEKANIKLEDKYAYPSMEYFSEVSKEKIYFVSSQDYDLIKSLNMLNIPVLKDKSIAQFINANNLNISSQVKSFDLLANFLPYQILSSRINGRAGFYQVGGAIGFRDQLQDSLAFSNKQEIIKNQIIECCMHQYEEGDVMHWWHPPQFGLRTRISDDKLFLPYTVSEYVELSKDMEFLEHNLPYLHSLQLYPNEVTRLENPPYTTYTESVYQHCIKAIKSSLKYGEHGLIIMGSGDWNDGMDYVCCEGKGESVFNSMFAYYVITKFASYCTPSTKKELLKISEELKENINKYCFDTDRYMRLFTDDGRWLGSSRSSTLQLDLLVQSFAVISGVADKERGNLILNTAKQLIDKDAGIIKLLEPPLNKDEYLGYISAYPMGIRENGGQYTHCAMWYLTALTKLDRQQEAYELFQMMNPVEKGADRNKYAKYKGEPYVLSGDVYSNAQNYGRSGWSWYTGSASWAYRLIIEQFYGLKRRGQKLYIYPHLPNELNDSIVTYNYMDSIYKITFKKGENAAITQDGINLDENFVLLEENKSSEVLVIY